MNGIKVVHIKQKNKIDEDWIYIGTSFLKYNSIKNDFSNQDIDISEDIHSYAAEKLTSFLKWNNNERLNHNDKIEWWMSHHNSRNNFVSKFYLQLCQILALVKYLKNNKVDKITIVCEDSFILKTVLKNLNEYKTYKTFYLHYVLSDISKLLLNALYIRSAEFYNLIKHLLYSKIYSKKLKLNLTGDIVLFHNCLDSSSFLEDPISHRFFSKLPEWLKSKGLKVVSLPWFYTNKINLKSAYKKLRQENYFIPDDWLHIHEYFFIFYKSIISSFYIKNKTSFENLYIKSLIFREQLLHLDSTSANFWKYNYAINRWAKNLNSLILISEFENNIFEHTLRYSIKRLPIKTKTIGYFHSLLSSEFLAHHTVANEWGSSIKPDKVICMGNLSYNFLIKQGAPKDNVIIGPALRQDINKYNQILFSKKNSNEILVLMSLSNDVNIEVFTSLLKINHLLENNYKVRIKPHPLMNFSIILNLLCIKDIPLNWVVDNGELIEILSKSTCCIAMSTASVYDAILCGTKVINLSSKFNIMDNYLDIFNNNFECTKSTNEFNLYNKIISFLNDKDDFYNNQFLKLREILLNGINPMDDINLNSFYKEITK